MKFKTIFRDKDIILKVSKHPPAKYLWVRPAATLFPMDHDGKILVQHEYKASVKRWVWSFPGGIIEPGETAAAGAKRECQEELGLKVKKVQKICEVKTVFPDTSVTYFLGSGLSKTKNSGWGTEKIGKIKRVAVSKLYTLALEHKISDPREIAAILKLFRKVKNGKIRFDTFPGVPHLR